MNIRLEIESVNINARQLHDRIMNDAGLWTFAAVEWHKLYEPYVPMREGVLKDTVSITPKQIEHTVPYANYQYNGTSFRFYRGQHPRASAQWDKAAEPTQKPKLISSMQAYVNQGRLKLNG